jgi:hypothetical protein
MVKQDFQSKKREWLQRYIPAEIIGTITALTAAWSTFDHTHSYIAATAAGWLAEGLGFYGYFIITELLAGSRRYENHSVFKRVSLAVTTASTNLLVEFLPAELFDNLVIRPYLMYLLPHYIHPYPIGFLAGKFTADILFYALAIVGYESRKHWLRR